MKACSLLLCSFLFCFVLGSVLFCYVLFCVVPFRFVPFRSRLCFRSILLTQIWLQVVVEWQRYVYLQLWTRVHTTLNSRPYNSELASIQLWTRVHTTLSSRPYNSELASIQLWKRVHITILSMTFWGYRHTHAHLTRWDTAKLNIPLRLFRTHALNNCLYTTVWTPNLYMLSILNIKQGLRKCDCVHMFFMLNMCTLVWLCTCVLYVEHVYISVTVYMCSLCWTCDVYKKNTCVCKKIR